MNVSELSKHCYKNCQIGIKTKNIMVITGHLATKRSLLSHHQITCTNDLATLKLQAVETKLVPLCSVLFKCEVALSFSRNLCEDTEQLQHSPFSKK